MDYQGTAILVDASPDGTLPQFTFSGGEHINSSFAFNLLAGVHLITNVKFIDNKAIDVLISLKGQLILLSVYVE